MKRVENSVEVESKFELSEADFRHLLDSGRLVKRKEQLNVYYDADGKLSEAAVTFRVRFTRGRPPRVTLKIPTSQDRDKRTALEVEADYESRLPLRCFNVQSDLPREFSSPLEDLGVLTVRRVGWMRTTRWVVALEDDLQVELDRVALPNGRVFFEAEVEESEDERHSRAIGEIRRRVSQAIPSRSSKFERFASALEDCRPSDRPVDLLLP